MDVIKGEDIFVSTLTCAYNKFPRMIKKCYSIHEIKPNVLIKN